MHRFFCAHANLNSTVISLSDQAEIHHLKNVLRLKIDNQISLFDGSGKEALGTILSIQRKKVEVRIDQLLPRIPRQGLSIILACAIPKRAKFEWIVEKCTELGVDEIIPMKTQRTELSLRSVDIRKKTLRYKTIAINAAKQSKRTTIPIIHPLTNFENIIQNLDQNTIALIPCLTGDRKLINSIHIDREKKIIFLIGPEGDFTSNEVELAKSHGCIPVDLGATVLKVDTAAMAVLAYLKFIS